MNLVIDAGNTLVKAALFENNEMKSFYSFDGVSAEEFNEKVISLNAVSRCILSSVIKIEGDFKLLLSSKCKLLELDSHTPLPIANRYHTPHTLGNDRIASAVAANEQFRNTNVLVIDAGTCIKYDFVNDRNEYLGGAISPGIEMRFKALNSFTAQLPLLNYQPIDYLIGDSTEHSILSGVLNGVQEEVTGIIRRYASKYPDLSLVYTGGYHKYFERIFNDSKSLNIEKSSIFADPFLVLKGLNIILNHNSGR